MDPVGWLAVVGAYLAAIYVCFQKGRQGLGWWGVLGLIPFFTPVLAWFPVVGALRLAKPDSPWARSHYSPAQMYLAAERYPSIEAPPEARQLPASTDPSGAHSKVGATPVAAEITASQAIVEFLLAAIDENVIDEATFERLHALRKRQSWTAAASVQAPSSTIPATAPIPPPQWIPPPVSAPAAPSVQEPARPLTSPPPPPPLPADKEPVPAGPPPTAPTSWPQPSQPAAATRTEALRSAPRPAITTARAKPSKPVVVTPSRLSQLWDSASSDMAVHGLAYLGVLATLVGTLGFLIFAFVDVDDQVQPFVELFLAAIFFGWAWMLRSQTHAQGRSFYTAGREAGRGKGDLEFYLASYPEDPVANGLLGAFLYFTDAVPAVLQFISKLMFMPTGDRARGLRMIELAESGQSAKAEDFRTLVMTVNVLFEGRWEEGLPQAISLQEDYPAYVRMVLPLSAMRMLAPAFGGDLTARSDVSETIVAGRPLEEVDTASLWMSRTYQAWIDRLLLGPLAAEKGFAAIVAAAPTEPDWVTEFAERQLEELAADRTDGVPDELVASVWTLPADSLAQAAAQLERLADSSLRAAFFAAECRLRMNEIALAERHYRKVATWEAPDHLEPFRMVASARVGEIKARDGRYRSASRWYERAVSHHRDVYRVDWMLQGRARGKSSI